MTTSGNPGLSRRAPGIGRWFHAWPDALAFSLGLAMAWWFAWRVGDLVWTLWLSSLVVGYCMILWNIFGRALTVAWRHPGDVVARVAESPLPSILGLLLIGAGGLFMLAFFTVHFGGFHFVHSVFLNAFFPIWGEAFESGDFPDGDLYLEVLRRYGWFLPLAFVAERASFRPFDAKPQRSAEGPAARITDPALHPQDKDDFFAPYRGVVRMHLLIFFFAGAAALHLDHFLVYAVVYAVYFFPWRMLSKGSRNA